jgi:predicted membrane protein
MVEANSEVIKAMNPFFFISCIIQIFFFFFSYIPFIYLIMKSFKQCILKKKKGKKEGREAIKEHNCKTYSIYNIVIL